MQRIKLLLCHSMSKNKFKINSEQINDLNVKPEIIKLGEENIGSEVFDIGLSNIFFGCISIFSVVSPQAREIEEKINE